MEQIEVILSEPDIKAIAYKDAHKLMGDIRDMLQVYIGTENELTANQRLLVISRAINGNYMMWTSFMEGNFKSAFLTINEGEKLNL
jgi:hypothetical protein